MEFSNELLNFKIENLVELNKNKSARAKMWLLEKDHVLQPPVANLQRFCEKEGISYNRLRNGDRVKGWRIVKNLG